MTEFNGDSIEDLAGLHVWEECFPEQFEGLTDAEKRSVSNVIHSHVFEGWVPTAPAVEEIATIVRNGRRKG